MSAPRKGLDALFCPRSVAIIGASDDVTRISGRTMRYLRESRYAGVVYPVNPRRETVQSVRAYPSVEALRMIREIKAYAVLEGVRGAGRADIETLARALASLSQFAAANADTIDSMDINPFLVLPEGAGAVALDAVIIPRAPLSGIDGQP